MSTYIYKMELIKIAAICFLLGIQLNLSATIDPMVTSAISNITANGDGTFEVEYTFNIQNNGTNEMCNISLMEDFQTDLGCAFIPGSVTNPVVNILNAAGGTSNINGEVNFDGTSANENLLNPLSNGCLFPGDEIEVVIKLQVDPTCAAASSPLQIMAQVSADENSAPGSLFYDNSDDITDMNNDGISDNESGGPQDPTDLYLPVISSVKSVVKTTTLPSGNIDVTYRMAMKNMGNADMSTLSMVDDLSTQFGTSLIGMSTTVSPNISISSSTATSVPTVNSSYDGMTNTDVFVGASSDILEHGQEIVVEIVVEIDPNATSWPLKNQATAKGEALNKNGTAVYFIDANPFEAFDATDSGVSFEDTNPNEPGDLGSANDATPFDCIPASIVITTDNAVICEGESVSLNVSSNIPGAIFHWNEMGSTTVISTSNTPTFNDLTAGTTYEVELQIPEGTCVYNIIETQTITVNAKPIVEMDVFHEMNDDCSPSALSFEGVDLAGDNFSSYAWTGPNSWSSTVAVPTIPSAQASDNGTYSVMVTDVNGCTAEESLQVTDIQNAVMQPIISSSGPACEGDEIVLNISQYSGSVVDYTWTTPGGITNDISGFGTNEIVLGPVSSTQAGMYTIDLDVDGCQLSASYNVTVEETPAVNAQFITVDSCAGGNFEFNSNATGIGNLTYEWTGPNGWTSTLPNPGLTNADVTNNGQYVLAVTSPAGCVAIDDFQINNILPEPATPSIQSNGPEICDGDPIELNSSGAGMQYEWISTSDSPGSLAQTGMTTAGGVTSFDPSHPEYQDGPWRVRVTDVNGCVAESETINIQINPIPEAVATNSGPVCEGDDLVLFSSIVPSATYSWYDADPALGGNLVSTDQNMMMANLDPGPYTYFLQVELNGCFSTIVETTGMIGEQPTVTNDFTYVANTDCSATDIQLNSIPTPGSNPIVSYEWTGPDGFTSVDQNPMIPTANTAANGSYTVLITDAIGCTASSILEISDVVDPLASTPIINSSGPACEGDEIILTTQLQEGTNVTYTWTLPGTGSTTAGINTNELIITQVDNANHSGTYMVTVNVDGCEIESEFYDVQVGQAPTISTDFAYTPNLNCASTNVDFTSTVMEGNTVIESYHWTGPNGFTSVEENPSILNAGSANNGSYILTVMDQFGCTTTSTIQVADIVDGLVSNPVINSSGPVCPGDEIVLNTEAQDGTNVTYSWTTPNGTTNISGLNSNQLIISLADQGDHEGNYTVTVNVDGCETESQQYFVDIFEQPNASPAAPLAAICHGDQLALSANPMTDVVSYSWTGPNGFTSTVENPVINNVDINNNGQYDLVVTSISGCTSTLSIPFNLILEEPEPSTIISQGPHCEGDDIVFTTSSVGMQYEWLGPLGTSTSTLATPGLTTTDGTTIIDPTHPAYMSGSWSVLVTDLNGCEVSSNNINIELVEIPVSIATNTSDVCEGNDVQLLASDVNNGNFLWYDADPSTSGNLISTSQNPMLFTPAAGSMDYYLVVDRLGCQSAAQITTVEVNTLPTIDPTTVYTLNVDCSLSGLDLESNITGNGPFEFNWSGPNTFVSTLENPAIPEVTEEANGSYLLSVVDANGCTAFETVELSDITNPVAQPIIESSGPACDNGIVVLTAPAYAGSNVTYTWTTPNGIVTDISGVNTNELTISPVDTTFHEGDYILTVEVDNCIISSAAYNLEIYSDPPAAVPSAIDFGICEGDDILLLSELEGFYYWSGPNGFSSTLQNPAIGGASMSDAGIYTLTVENEQGCVSDPVSITIDVTRRPTTPTVVLANDEICNGESITLQTSTICDTYHWIGPGGSSAFTLGNVFLTTTANTTTIPAGNIAYEEGLWSVVCVNASGCESEPSNAVSIVINDFPEPFPIASADLICGNEDFQLFSGDGYAEDVTFNWFDTDPAFGGANLVSNLADPIFTDHTNFGTLTYWLSITQNGCTATSPISLQVSPAVQLSVANDGMECVDPTTDLNLFSSVTSGVMPYSFDWSGPNDFASISQSPMLPNATNPLSGTYVVVVTDANGCTAEAATVLDVTVVPDEPFLSYTGQACEGQDITIVAPEYDGFDVVYEWIGPNGTTTEGSYTNGNIIVLQEAGLIANGAYQVQVTVDGCTSILSESLPIEINPIPTVNPLNDGTFCAGANEILNLESNLQGGEGPFTYYWSGPNGYNSNAINPVLPNAGVENSGTYTLYVVDGNGCHSETMATTVDITDMPATPQLVVEEKNVCEGSSLFLETQVYSGTAVVYNWQMADGSIIQTDAPYFWIDAVTPGVHDGLLSVFVSINGCESNMATQVFMNVTDAPAAPIIENNATINSPICEGEDVQFNTPIIPGAIYEWTGPNGFSSNIPNPSIVNALLDNNGIYTLVIYINGCPSEVVTSEVNIQPSPITPVIMNAGPYCIDQEIELMIINADPNIVYNWYNGFDNSFVGTGSNFALPAGTFSGTNEFYAIAESDNCSSLESLVTSVVVDSPSMDDAYAGEDQVICIDSTILDAIIVENGTGIWTMFDADNDSQIVNPDSEITMVTELETGENIFVWSIISGACGVTSSDEISVFVNSDPIAIDDAYTLVINEDINENVIVNDEPNAMDYELTIISQPTNGTLEFNADGSFYYIPNENFVGEDEFLYKICHTYCDENCVQASVSFKIGGDADCFAPDLITPNEDNLNDNFVVPCLANYPGSSICIFNRWGDQVYFEDNYQNNWNGTYQGNGETLPIGTYYYVIDVADGNNTKMTGYIFIQR